MSYEVKTPQEGLYECDSKKDFIGFYEAHKDCIDQGTFDGTIEIKFINNEDGNVKIYGIPDTKETIMEALDNLPCNITVQLFREVRTV